MFFFFFLLCAKEKNKLSLVRDIMNIANATKEDVGFRSIDQEKAFDKVDHIYLFETLKTFGLMRTLSLGSNCYTLELLHC